MRFGARRIVYGHVDQTNVSIRLRSHEKLPQKQEAKRWFAGRPTSSAVEPLDEALEAVLALNLRP